VSSNGLSLDIQVEEREPRLIWQTFLKLKDCDCTVDFDDEVQEAWRGELLDWQKEFNKQVNKIRYVIEQVTANFKTWRIMHTDYHRPLATFPETISAAVALRFYATA